MVAAVENFNKEQQFNQNDIDVLKLDQKIDPDQPEIDVSKNYNKQEVTVNNEKFYLPLDKDKRQKILDAREDVQQIILEMQKLEKNPSDINFFINQYLKENDLTREEISGKFPSPETDFYKSYTNRINKNILDLMGTIIDLGYVIGPANEIEMGAKKMKEINNAPNLEEWIPANEEIKTKLHEVFKFMNFIDPNFTPDTFWERVGDNMGAFTLEALPISGGLTKVTSANKFVVQDPELLKGVFNKAKNNTKILLNGIIDIYDTAKKEGRLGKQVMDDILATMGFSFGSDLSKEISEATRTTPGSDPSIIGTPLRVANETLMPFLGAGAFMKIGKWAYEVPINTYNSLNNLVKEYAAFNKTNPDESFTKNLVENYFKKKNDKKAQEIATEINQQINPDEIAAREASLSLENRINSYVVQEIKTDKNGNEYIVQTLKDDPENKLSFTLAQATENPSLIETQQKIEQDLIASGFKIQTPGRQKQQADVAQNVKDISLNNYKVVDESLQREFPDKQFIYTTVVDDQGKTKVVAVEKNVGNFYSYFNSNNKVGGVVDQAIDEELTAQQNILTPGATIKTTTTNVSEEGNILRSKYEKLKDSTRDTYNNKLITLVDDSFGDRGFDFTNFKDRVISLIKPDLGAPPGSQKIPQQFYTIKNIGNDFEPIITSAANAVDNAYNKYLNEPTTSNYKTYLETIKKIENNLVRNIENLNGNLQKKFDAGEIAVAPKYNLGEIKFIYPKVVEFDSSGNVIAGVDDIGKAYLGKEVTDKIPPNIGGRGPAVGVEIVDPTLDIPIKQLVLLKEDVLRDLNLAYRQPNENSDLIQRLSILNKEIDKVIDDNMNGIKAYDDWRIEKKLNYTDIFEKGQINKVLTQTGTGEYVIPDELVGKSFLQNAKSVDEFFGTFGDDAEAVKGIENAFYDKLFSTRGGILNKDGLIDITKLKNFKQNNKELIEALDQYIPISEQIDNQISLGVNAANRLKVLNDRKKFADYVELDNFVKDKGFGSSLVYKNPDDMIKNALKDPEQMSEIVKVLSKSDDPTLLTAFKNQLFDKFLDSATSYKYDRPIIKGGTPSTLGMTKFLQKNEAAIKAYYNALGDKEGYQRLLDITEAYRRLNLTAYPQRTSDIVPDKIKAIFGTGIPQILSRVFAVQSGRTSSRFVGAELAMRFMRSLNTAQREKIIAAALYDKNNAAALLKLLEGKQLRVKDLNLLKGIFGKTYGLIGTSVEDEMKQETGAVPSGYETLDAPPPVAKTTSSLDTVTPSYVPKLNIPNVSPASSLSNVNMSNMTRATMPDTLKRGQALFGANDPIFGGIASV